MQYYFDTLFPRIPVPVLRQVVSNLEKLKLPSTHSGSTGETTRHGSDDTARRPPSVKAALSVSFGQRAPHRASTRDSSPIRRTLPSHEKNGSDDIRRSPSNRRSQSREYPDRDRDRDRDRSQSRDRDRERDRDRDRERDRDRYCDRDRNREWERDRDRDRERYRDHDSERDQDRDRIRRNNERERERERIYDYDKRSKYTERESSRDYDNGSKHYRRSRSRSRSRSLQAGTAQYESRSSPQREESKRTSASSNLAQLKDMYGDLGDNKGDANMERIPRKDSGGEEVIRLGGSTWKD